MRASRAAGRALLLTLALGGVAPPGAGQSPLPASRLAVQRDGRWQEWWRAGEAATQWRAPDPALLGALSWSPAGPGLEWAEARLSGSGEAWRLRLIVARLDPARVHFDLDTAFTRGRERAAWRVEAADSTARFAVNAGQFPYTLPWGWVVIRGREFLPPGRGPLSMAMVVDSSGTVRWVEGEALDDPAARRGAVTAFQSYPTLLSRDGTVPPALRAGGLGVDVSHRDARLAIGQDREGRIVVALTRFDVVGGALDFVPFGLTAPEMAAVMGALGAHVAVMLDGGISAQMLIRAPDGDRRWEGLRRVPMGLVARPRPATGPGAPPGSPGSR